MFATFILGCGLGMFLGFALANTVEWKGHYLSDYEYKEYLKSKYSKIKHK